ncbi:MAG: endolytic transglycosylase MltG [Spirochaetes bacterium]|nr:endolytic transglycosylase MltG [Spirochaetota bacterium]
MKKTVKIITILLAILGGGVVGLTALAGYLNSPVSTNGEGEEEFSILKGESVSTIADRLEQKGLIRSADFLIWLSRWKGTEKQYRVGHYRIPKGKSTLFVHDLLVKGVQALYRVTIPEGWTISRIGRLLESKGIVSVSEFLSASKQEEILKKYGIPTSSVEGYLFPETYYFPKDYPAIRVIERMVETFFQRLATIVQEKPLPTGKELLDKVILASIIEREYRDPEEAPMISSVFYNRLKIRMPLGSCATVEYVLTEELGKPHPDMLTYEDLEVPSPYNTYKHSGLPPGPICNPGETALKAAFYPAETDYRYFVLKDPEGGRHHFSKTLQEHMQAKVVYLKKIQPGS